ncbi:hypothetical protein MSAN_02119500 [Mycena sanguinolenta]|uniref:Uncharacterized protein n=1 Tax=Mycena sanguinolenta TaxID=230812 RepID=A0A8H7CKC6_9AGAR|nr:hypothetical protein MSAN_02119500 [Mycena sanguinolenta]
MSSTSGCVHGTPHSRAQMQHQPEPGEVWVHSRRRWCKKRVIEARAAVVEADTGHRGDRAVLDANDSGGGGEETPEGHRVGERRQLHMRLPTPRHYVASPCPPSSRCIPSSASSVPPFPPPLLACPPPLGPSDPIPTPFTGVSRRRRDTRDLAASPHPRP